MGYKNLIWMAILVSISTSSNAQMVSNSFTVNFKVDENILDNEDKLILDDIIKQVKAEKYCEINLSAHTDNDAGNQYNIALSKRRALSVYNYLKENGIVEKTIDIDWYGENKPTISNITEDNKALNRRVEIEVIKYNLNTISDLMKVTGGDYTQKFKLESSNENIIVAKNGTKITLPKDAFETENGKAVDSKNVEVVLQEFQKPMDAIFNNLSTVCNGKILESGGMFDITATANGEKLKLKNGKNIAVEMPSSNIKNNMSVFTGVKTKNGTIEWKEEKAKFNVKPKTPIELPFTKLDEKYLKTLYQNTDKKTKVNYNLEYILPKPISKPTMPKKPKMHKTPTMDEMFGGAEKLIYSKKKRERMLQNEIDLREKMYQKKMAKYEKKLANYYINLENYPKDSLAFENRKESFYAWINEEIAKHELVITEYEKEAFNISLNKLIRLSETNKLKTSQPENILCNNVQFANSKSETKYNTAKTSVLLLNWLYKKNYTEICELSQSGALNYYSKKVTSRFTYAILYTNFRFQNMNSTYNKFAKNLAKEDEYLAEIFKNAKLDIFEKKQKLGLLNIDNLSNIYTASFSSMGFINCDRFNQDELADVKIQVQENDKVYFYIKDLNTIYSPHEKINNGIMTATMPTKHNVTMVVVNVTEGIPMLEVKELNGKAFDNLKTNPTQTNIKDIYKRLAML